MEIRKCRKEEIRELMNFINDFWSRGHVLSKNKKLIDWQYFNEEKNNYNFIIAKDNGKMVGILGYIPISKYSYNLDEDFIWLTTWKVIEDPRYSGVGLKLLLYLNDKYKKSGIGTVGNNIYVSKIYNLLGYKIGKLNHYVLVNTSINNYRILGLKENNNIKSVFLGDEENNSCKDIVMTDKLDLSEKNKVSNKNYPYKSLKYYKNRFEKNPFYNYVYLKIYENKKLIGFLVGRYIEYRSSKILRIVDLFGENEMLKGLNSELRKIVEDKGLEYIDFYNYGIPDELLNSAGFINKDNIKEIIVPNYFEPFEKRNIDVLFSYKYDWKKYKYIRITKGDCDQDRPNLINE